MVKELKVVIWGWVIAKKWGRVDNMRGEGGKLKEQSKRERINRNRR
jgi:hypothetical protein